MAADTGHTTARHRVDEPWQRQSQVFPDRDHDEAISTPQQAPNTL
jgi:hypothetical protein